MSSIVLLEQNVFELIAPFSYSAEQCKHYALLYFPLCVCKILI